MACLSANLLGMFKATRVVLFFYIRCDCWIIPIYRILVNNRCRVCSGRCSPLRSTGITFFSWLRFVCFLLSLVLFCPWTQSFIFLIPVLFSVLKYTALDLFIRHCCWAKNEYMTYSLYRWNDEMGRVPVLYRHMMSPTRGLIEHFRPQWPNQLQSSARLNTGILQGWNPALGSGTL